MDSGKVVVTDNGINPPSDGPCGFDQQLNTFAAHTLDTAIRVRKVLPRDVVHEGIIVGKHAESRIQQCCYGRRAGIVRRIRHKCNLLLFLHSRSSWWFRSRAIRWTPATAPPSRLAMANPDVRPSVPYSTSGPFRHRLQRIASRVSPCPCVETV